MKNISVLLKRLISIILLGSVVIYFGHQIYLKKREQNDKEILKFQKKEMADIAENAFAKKYKAVFFEYKEKWNDRVLTYDIQQKVQNNTHLVFYAFLDDIEEKNGEFLIHLTCPLSKNCFKNQQIKFHLKANTNVRDIFLRSKSLRNNSFLRKLDQAPLLVVAEVEKISKEENRIYYDEDAECIYDGDSEGDLYLNGYGKIIDVKHRDLEEE